MIVILFKLAATFLILGTLGVTACISIDDNTHGDSYAVATVGCISFGLFALGIVLLVVAGLAAMWAL